VRIYLAGVATPAKEEQHLRRQVDTLEFEQTAVAVLDHDRGSGQAGQLGQRVGQAAVDQAVGQVARVLRSTAATILPSDSTA
jgi:hypothetical protein